MKSHLLTKSIEISCDLFEKGKYTLFLSPILIFFQTYIFSDVEYLKWLVVLMVCDTGLGLGRAIWKKEVDKDKFGDILIKIVVYSACLVVGHVLANVTISGDTIPGGHYMKILIYAAIVVKEAISILENAGKISKTLVPTGILKRLKAFDDSGDIKDLDKDPEKENLNNPNNG